MRSVQAKEKGILSNLWLGMARVKLENFPPSCSPPVRFSPLIGASFCRSRFISFFFRYRSSAISAEWPSVVSRREHRNSPVFEGREINSVSAGEFKERGLPN